MSFHGSLSFWAQFRFFFSSSVLHNQKKYNNLVTQQCRPVFIINIRSSVYSIVFYYAISASISSTIFVSLFFFPPLKLFHSLHLSVSVPHFLNPGEVFDYLVAHGRMKEKEARAKFRQVRVCVCSIYTVYVRVYLIWKICFVLLVYLWKIHN